MPARTNSGFGWTALFWSFALGVTAALAVAAAVFMFVNNAPVPFVNKVDQSAVAVNEELLDGRLDPNKKLYAEGQGEVQQAAQPGAVAAVTADGKSATALPGSAAAQGTSEGETLDTHRYWVQAGAFSQSADAESMRARIALRNTVLGKPLRDVGVHAFDVLPVVLFLDDPFPKRHMKRVKLT